MFDDAVITKNMPPFNADSYYIVILKYQMNAKYVEPILTVEEVMI